MMAQLAAIGYAEISLRRSSSRRGLEAGDVPVHKVHLNRPPYFGARVQPKP